ncbi:DUF1266 domain-containing protein [Chitinophaga sp. 212800010-3]|uniref:DUF1266 domain-containing protein n=1 Tax=unclassified Chitinophaga TaxID=2619133 RepID=UPI002DE9B353|nr:DUF1266 domain-containing protein [Chitinophaga sp. 212800010-3]
MDQQDYMEQYWNKLRSMGLSEEEIAMYKETLKPEEEAGSAWFASSRQLSANSKQLRHLFSGDDADVNDWEDGTPALLLHQGEPLDTLLQWGIACGADTALVNRHYLNQLATGKDAAESRQLLAEWWEIHHREELLDMLHWLKECGHRIEFDVIWQAINLVSVRESKAFLKEYIVNNELEEVVVMERWRNTREALELFREKQLTGEHLQPEMLIWDFARIINLSRLGYDAGYITAEEAAAYITGCVPSIKRTYTSWKHLSVSYQFARCIWNGAEAGSFESLAANMELLLTAADSPWVQQSFS